MTSLLKKRDSMKRLIGCVLILSLFSVAFALAEVGDITPYVKTNKDSYQVGEMVEITVGVEKQPWSTVNLIDTPDIYLWLGTSGVLALTSGTEYYPVESLKLDAKPLNPLVYRFSGQDNLDVIAPLDFFLIKTPALGIGSVTLQVGEIPRSPGPNYKSTYFVDFVSYDFPTVTKDIIVTEFIGTDSDGDGITDEDEILYGTNPHDADSDDDGLTDYEEINYDGVEDYNPLQDTNPNNPDTDNDGLTDYEEINIYYTNPLEPDTDGDGISDYDEVHGPDGTLSTGDETDPNNPDSPGIICRPNTYLEGAECVCNPGYVENGEGECYLPQEDVDGDGIPDAEDNCLLVSGNVFINLPPIYAPGFGFLGCLKGDVTPATGDGQVNGDDYTDWLIEFRKSGDAAPSRGDMNQDGHVNGDDYTDWLIEYRK